ncbi:hypothetical protein LXL04_007444 [Taraxacum kok-saghyz]
MGCQATASSSRIHTYLPFLYPQATTDTFTDQHKISIDHHHFLPPQRPQKLRPIRCNGRSFTDCCSSDDPLDTKPLSWQPEIGFYDTEIGDASFIPSKASALGLSTKECQTEAVLRFYLVFSFTKVLPCTAIFLKYPS